METVRNTDRYIGWLPHLAEIRPGTAMDARQHQIVHPHPPPNDLRLEPAREGPIDHLADGAAAS